MKFVISLKGAPTDNGRHIIARYRRRIIDSEEYRQWKQDAITEFKSQKRGPMLVPTFENQLPYRVKVYMANKRTDHVNYTKGLQDVMKHAGIVSDDKWIRPIFEPCDIDPNNPRIEITIPYED